MNRERTIVLWCPDWPVLAARSATDLPADAPMALIEHGMVFACSIEARRQGVRRGVAQPIVQCRMCGRVERDFDPPGARRGGRETFLS